MPYNISKKLVNSLPENEQMSQESLGPHLLKISGETCNLCGGKMNVAAETLEADHDQPVREGGPTTLGNLRLVHQQCNRAKRNRRTSEVRPYLHLTRFIRDQGGRIKYDVAVEHFNISPKSSAIHLGETSIRMDFADSTSAESLIFEETTNGRTFRYAFLRLPRIAINNDDEVQPRVIRATHAISIYLDLLSNPLHEPPSCRLGPPDKDGLQRVLMFDGQHKTIANWMLGRDAVVAKVYLDMSALEANVLVNSIQAKIKKLPLSAFELSAKMSDEWQAKVDQYEAECRTLGITPSEKGFIDSMPAGQERNRAKAAFEDALVQSILDRKDLRLMGAVDVPGARGGGTGLTENMLKGKVLKRLLHMKALEESLADSSDIRAVEVENIVWLLNMVHDGLAHPAEEGESPTEMQLEARRRLFKQASLTYVADLLKQVFNHHMAVGDSNQPLKASPDQTKRDQIETSVKLLTSHPVWTAGFDGGAEMAAVKLALEKNQGVKEAFSAVALNLAYLVFGESDEGYRKAWAATT